MVVPSYFVAATLGLMPAVIGVLRYDMTFVLLAGLIQLVLGIIAVVGRLVLTAQRSRQHPVLSGPKYVVVRNVNQQSADAWADLNPEVGLEFRAGGSWIRPRRPNPVDQG
jgi:hypothetical protein